STPPHFPHNDPPQPPVRRTCPPHRRQAPSREVHVELRSQGDPFGQSLQKANEGGHLLSPLPLPFHSQQLQPALPGLLGGCGQTPGQTRPRRAQYNRQRGQIPRELFFRDIGRRTFPPHRVARFFGGTSRLF